jgi:hypothetical protein
MTTERTVPHSRQTRKATSRPRHTGLWAGKSRRNVVRMTIVYILLIVGGVFVSVPFVWMVSTSLKTLGQTFYFPPKWIPSPVLWSNYGDVFDALPFFAYFRNTALIAVLSVIGLLLSSSLAGYSFARLRWRGKDILFVVILSTMMLPAQVTMIPRFVLFRYLDWIDTYMPLIVPAWFGTAFQIFLLRQFFQTIPHEMEHAGDLLAHYRTTLQACADDRRSVRISIPLEPIPGTSDLFEHAQQIHPGPGIAAVSGLILHQLEPAHGRFHDGHAARAAGLLLWTAAVYPGRRHHWGKGIALPATFVEGSWSPVIVRRDSKTRRVLL